MEVCGGGNFRWVGVGFCGGIQVKSGVVLRWKGRGRVEEECWVLGEGFGQEMEENWRPGRGLVLEKRKGQCYGFQRKKK